VIEFVFFVCHQTIFSRLSLVDSRREAADRLVVFEGADGVIMGIIVDGIEGGVAGTFSSE
jgi:hypothetical protein